MSDLKNVEAVLGNPVVSMGLKMVAPQLAVGVDLLMSAVDGLFSSRRASKKLKNLSQAVDGRLAHLLEEIATTKSKHYRRECEIRAHEILHMLHEWEQIG